MDKVKDQTSRNKTCPIIFTCLAFSDSNYGNINPEKLNQRLDALKSKITRR